MAVLLQKLPTILVLAVLVGIFIALRRHAKSTRLQLWTAAWAFIFIHFLDGIFQVKPGKLDDLLYCINYGSLQVAAMLFVASLTSFVEQRRRTWTLLALTTIPVSIYTIAASFDWNYRALYMGCIAVLFFGPAIFILRFRRKFTPESIAWMPVVLATGAWGIYRAWNNDPAFGFLASLTIGYVLPGLLFWNRYRRFSPGVITTAGGFLLWGAVFPLGVFMAKFFPHVQTPDDLWNTPKFFVAFGMILTLLEDKSAVLEQSNSREHKLNEQLQKFASITSRLLTGVEVNSLCHDIANAITETSNFQRVSILLGSDDKGLYVAGHSGVSEEQLERIKKESCQWRLDDIANLCRVGAKLGQNSYFLKSKQIEKYCVPDDTEEVEPNPVWEKGCRLLVPLQSTRGTYVGCIALARPRDLAKITAEEMSKIELLAGDLAVTIDSTALHRQLVRSEKLAAIGQLVAGVAHELNNPLASIVGYSELLGDEVTEAPARQKLEKLVREAQRMKRIIENLLRFARQNSLAKKSANLEVLLQEVLSLREYHIRNNDVDVQIHIEQGLPPVALDEDQFKQILLNLLNNSIDALEQTAPKIIRVEAIRQDDKVAIRFEDNGPGFADLNRAFDPFYTTKPVGKGTGLGLSICYGIVKEHGGEVHALNVDPHGARVVLELPISEPVRIAAMAR
jgi:two-component system, NtrC family, sensor kinase